MRLEDKVAVITGAARGIGFACAQVFSGEGAKIVIADQLEKEGAEAAGKIKKGGGEAIFVKCDVTVPDDVRTVVDRAVDAYGGIDTCVINAGIAWGTEFLDITLDEWKQIMDVNLNGAFITGQAVARQLVKQGRGGTMVTIASTESTLAHAPLVHYVSSKGGVAQLTRGMAMALAGNGIRVNAVGPGSIMTPMLAVVAKDKELSRMQLSRTPLGRYGQPEEIAKVALFLASDESSYVTGQIIYADGGRLALHYTVPVDEDALAGGD